MVTMDELDEELRAAVKRVMSLEKPTEADFGTVQDVLWRKTNLMRKSREARLDVSP